MRHLLPRGMLCAMISNGNSFGASIGESLSPGFGEGYPWTVPTWKFGLRQIDDRGDI